jgi:hypothetical protein
MLLDAHMMSCYDAAVMNQIDSRLDSFYFYFYFGAATQPRLLRMGRSATVCEA